MGDKVYLYKYSTFALLRTLSGHKGHVHGIGFSRDGKLLVTGGSDKQVIVWSTRGEIKRRYNHGSSVQSVCFNPVFPIVDCAVNVGGKWRGRRLWTVQRGKLVSNEVENWRQSAVCRLVIRWTDICSGTAQWKANHRRLPRQDNSKIFAKRIGGAES